MGETTIVKNQLASKAEERRVYRLKLISVSPIQHPALEKFLEKRGIPLSVAKAAPKEVRVRNVDTDKTVFSLGLSNEENGYEIRNPFIKSCVGKKAISFIRGTIPKPQGVHIFEGFMDYLSMITQQWQKIQRRHNYPEFAFTN